MQLRDQRIGVWCGLLFCVLFGAGLIIAGFLPPPSPSLGADEVAVLYQQHGGMIRLGMLIAMGCSGLMVPFSAAISAQMMRIQSIGRTTVYTQFGAGAGGALLLILPTLVLAVTAFRPERNPQLTVLLNDLGWLMLIAPFSLALMQAGAIAYAVFSDRAATLVFPRWVAYFNIWVALLFLPGGLAFFFRSGPFAWNGLLAFWVAAAAFFGWFIVMAVMMFRAIRQQES